MVEHAKKKIRINIMTYYSACRLGTSFQNIQGPVHLLVIPQQQTQEQALQTISQRHNIKFLQPLRTTKQQPNFCKVLFSLLWKFPPHFICLESGFLVLLRVGLVEYSENKNRTNIANIQGGNERIPNIRSLSNCMQDCQWLIFFPKKIVFMVKMT